MPPSTRKSGHDRGVSSAQSVPGLAVGNQAPELQLHEQDDLFQQILTGLLPVGAEYHDPAFVVPAELPFPEGFGALPGRASSQAASTSGIPHQSSLPDNDQLEDQRGCKELVRVRERNRQAQKRFRSRQKEHLAESQRAIEELTTKMAELTAEKQRVDLRNRVLGHLLELTNAQVSDTRALQEAQQAHLRILGQESMKVWSNIPGVTLPTEACSIHFPVFVEEDFPRLLEWQNRLLQEGGWDPASGAGRQLTTQVMLRRNEEARYAMFSDWFTALHGYNVEATERMACPDGPSTSFWAQVLAGLHLTQTQQQAIISARAQLVSLVAAIRLKRERVVIALGLALLQNQMNSGTCQAAKDLQASLEEERLAVLDFLYAAVDNTLTAAQEAHLDVHSYPWYPCIWHMSCLLTARARHQLHIQQQQQQQQERQEADPAADTWESAKRLRSQGSSEAGPPDEAGDWSEERHTQQLLAELPAMDPAASSRLSAQHSAFRMLTSPITACGIGLRFKRGLVAIPVPDNVADQTNDVPRLPSIAQLSQLSIMDCMMGKYKQESGAAQTSGEYGWCLQRALRVRERRSKLLSNHHKRHCLVLPVHRGGHSRVLCRHLFELRALPALRKTLESLIGTKELPAELQSMMRLQGSDRMASL
ncbi:hypothetical protein WJX73_007424 [Symbiochloris irregularis]|uniref:BZIP domain-containing protein n=1 Tax=Symbiochloris irregularis TaxID=706552 RepID=A0AAW1PID5_9CHLO